MNSHLQPQRPSKRIRVMIVEDSRPVREMLEYIIGSDPRLEVAAQFGNAEDALKRLHQVAPDVISMDIRLPGMDGLEATQHIMAERPTPIVVISASIESDSLNISMNALRAGALSVVEKPVNPTHRDYAKLAERICTQLVIMSEVRVIRQRARRSLGSLATQAPQGAVRASPSLRREPGNFRILGITTSTGGPNALAKLLPALGANLPVPILLVQHITPGFLAGFVSWLDGICPMPVVEAADGVIPENGKVYVAPAEFHLTLERGRLRLASGGEVCLHRPSGTVLFRSLARALGSACFGILLTGMGDDGAAGLREIREAGGYAIAEDESTSVVYGMPAAAVAMGAVCESLPLDEIAPRVLQLLFATSTV